MRNYFKAFKITSGAAILLTVILLVSAISYFRLLNNFELNTLDIRFILRPSSATIDDKIAVIEIGEDSIAKLGRFPFDRNFHAILINALSEFGANAIIFDLLFGSPQEHDAELEEAIAQSGRTYLAQAFDINSADKSNEVLANGYAVECLLSLARKAKGVGHINVLPDADGKFRHISPYIKYNNVLYPNLSFLAACNYIGVEMKDVKFYPGRYISCGDKVVIPLNERSEMVINYSGKWGRVFKHYSYVDVIQSYMASAMGEKPILDPKLFKDKVCIIGLNTIGMDIHPSPFEPIYPGVGIHAEIFKSIVSGHFIGRVSKWINLIFLLFLCGIIAIIAFMEKPINGLLLLCLTIAGSIVLSLGLFDLYGVWLDMVCPVLAMILLYLSLTLYKYISEWKSRLRSEFELGTAKSIQESFLPKSIPEVRGIDIKAAMFTARQIGGDLYDFIEFEDGRFGIMIGDVSGKGIPASLFMAMVMGEFRCLNAADLEPRTILSRLNAKLVKESASNLFVTMFYAIFDLKKNTVNFANGGHLPIIHLSSRGASEFLDVDEGMPLAIIDGAYSEKSINFSKGDTFVFYTDGITEAMDHKRDMYGKERLLSVVEKNGHLPAQEILECIEKDVRLFEPKSSQHDDITAIVVKII